MNVMWNGGFLSNTQLNDLVLIIHSVSTITLCTIQLLLLTIHSCIHLKTSLGWACSLVAKMLVGIPISDQPPVNVHLGRQQVTAQAVGNLTLMWLSRWSSWLPAMAWPNPGCCTHSGCESTDGNSACMSTSQINEINNKARKIKQQDLLNFTPATYIACILYPIKEVIIKSIIYLFHSGITHIDIISSLPFINICNKWLLKPSNLDFLTSNMEVTLLV